MSFDVAALPIHFLRPQALWLLCALPLIWWWFRRARQSTSDWVERIDPHLRPHVLEGGSRATRAAIWPWLLAWALAITALAGPGWQQVPLDGVTTGALFRRTQQ